MQENGRNIHGRDSEEWHPRQKGQNSRPGGVTIEVVHKGKTEPHYIEPRLEEDNKKRQDGLIDLGRVRRGESVERTAQAISSHLIEVRESFLNDREGEIVAYDRRHDQKAYEELSKYRYLFPEAYELVKNSLNGYTRNQVETHIGERHQVQLSMQRYEIRRNDVTGRDDLYGEGTNEPFLNMIQRGRDFCRKKSEVVDHPREDAEVLSFEMMRDRLTSPDAEIGQMELLISRPGEGGYVQKDGVWQFIPSRYQHNFYDVFTLKEEHGRRFVESRRYSSGLNMEETLLGASELNSDVFRMKEVKSADLLRFTTTIDPRTSKYKTAEDVHKLFHSGREFLSEGDFELVLEGCDQFIDEYLRVLCDFPEDINLQEKCFKAILNKAEQVVKDLSMNKIVFIGKQGRAAFLKERDELGEKEIIFRETGCGPSGRRASSSIPFGVMEASGVVGSNGIFKPGWHDGICASCGADAIVGGCNICQVCVDRYFGGEQAA